MKRIWTLFALIAFLFAGLSTPSCKDDDSTTPDPTTGPLTLHENVLVVDSSQHHLEVNPVLLAAGTYRFTSSGAALQAKVGMVIVGAQGQGFLRKVTAVTTSGNQTTLQTQQASLDEVFSGGSFTITSSMDSLHQRRGTSDGLSYSFGSHTIYQGGPLTLSMQSGSVSLNPNWEITVGFGPQQTLHAKVATNNGTLDGNMVLTATATGAATLPTRTDTIKRYKKDFTRWVMAGPVPVPIVVRMNLDLLLQSSARLDAKLTRTATFNTHSVFNVGLEYADGNWHSIHDFTPSYTFTRGPLTGNANMDVQVAVVPAINFRLYGALGPYASVGLHTQLQAAIAYPSRDWNYEATDWLGATVGATGSILGHKLPDYSAHWDTEKQVIYRTPDHLRRIVGDNQTGSENKDLPVPLKVRVLDSNNSPQSNVKVYFTPVAAGNGSALPDTVRTDADGYAQATWKLGAATKPIQYLDISAKKADGQDIDGSPLDFAAFADNCDSSIPLQFDSVSVVYGLFTFTDDGLYITEGCSVVFHAKGGDAPFTVNGIGSSLDGRGNLNCTEIQNIYFGPFPTDSYPVTRPGPYKATVTCTITDAKGNSQSKSVERDIVH